MRNTWRHASKALAAAMDSITKVAVRKDMKARRMRITCELEDRHIRNDKKVKRITVEQRYPASLNAAGKVRAPVPTIRLKM